MLSWLSCCWYEANYAIMYMAFTLTFSLRIEGRNNIPRVGPVLLVANHQSFLDPVLVGLATRRHLQTVARKTLFRHRLLAWLMRSFRAIPIDHEGIGKEGLKAVLNELEGGNCVLIFPEGTRTKDGRMQPLRPGIHLLLKRAKVPIVPVGIAGAYAAWPIWRPYPLPAPLFLPAKDRAVAVSAGPPLDGHYFATLPRDRALNELFQQLQKAACRAERLRRRSGGQPVSAGLWRAAGVNRLVNHAPAG
jgi:1-acyl-sn-glycerol-3-phosphate acyltransferase